MYIMSCDLADVVPGSPPQNVRARPVSSNTVVVQWDEPKLSNGVIRVQLSASLSCSLSVCLFLCLSISVSLSLSLSLSQLNSLRTINDRLYSMYLHNDHWQLWLAGLSSIGDTSGQEVNYLDNVQYSTLFLYKITLCQNHAVTVRNQTRWMHSHIDKEGVVVYLACFNVE